MVWISEDRENRGTAGLSLGGGNSHYGDGSSDTYKPLDYPLHIQLSLTKIPPSDRYYSSHVKEEKTGFKKQTDLSEVTP